MKNNLIILEHPFPEQPSTIAASRYIQNLKKHRMKTQKKQSPSTIEQEFRKNTRPLHLNIFEERDIQLQNQRLNRKLSEINSRKSRVIRSNADDYVTINTKSREASKKLKSRQLQEQNELIVERLFIRMQGGKNHSVFIPERKSPKREKKQAKKHVSLMLPYLQV